VKLDRGTIVLVELDPTVGHEQHGTRPCIAVSDPAVNADQRFPLIAVVPITGTRGEGALYPELSQGKSGLTKTSYALIDHMRSVDKRRIRRVFGRVARDELDAVDQGLELFLGLAAQPAHVGQEATRGIPEGGSEPQLQGPRRRRTAKRRS
jgi:mRNA interferase MazF